jgi:hypothetical protein
VWDLRPTYANVPGFDSAIVWCLSVLALKKRVKNSENFPRLRMKIFTFFKFRDIHENFSLNINKSFLHAFFCLGTDLSFWDCDTASSYVNSMVGVLNLFYEEKKTNTVYFYTKTIELRQKKTCAIQTPCSDVYITRH